MDGRDPTKDFHEKLDLHAPILSTRRLVNYGNVAAKIDSGRERGVAAGFHSRGSVPFLWERAPGLARDVSENRGRHEDEVPPPKPPPNQWHPSHYAYSDEDGFSLANENYDNLARNDEDGDVFTDAMDVISLSESFDRACSTAAKSSSLTPEALKSAGNLSPNYIIRRFLPAANAIALSASQNPPKNFPERSTPRHQNGHARESWKSFSSYQSTNTSSALEGGPRTMVRSYSPPKACGLEVFSPLRLKHVLCGLKSPIQASPTRLKFKRENPANGAANYGPKRKREKTGTKGVASEGESSVDRLDARSAPEFSRHAWLHAPLNSPTQSWRSHGHYRR